MKATILTIFILLFFKGFIYSQQQPYNYKLNIQYKMTYQPDSTNKNSSVIEFMTLLIGDEQSLYCPTDYLVIDSAISAEASKGNKIGPSYSFFMSHPTHNRLVIFKTNNDLMVYDQAAPFVPTVYQYTEAKLLFNWRILPDTLSIANISCQKAEVNFGSRKWIAWFAPDIPISDGPYKFNGLPGLIIRIADTQNYWEFNLVTLKKISTSLLMSFSNKIPSRLKNKDEYFKLKKYSRDNRFEIMKLRGWKTSNDAAAKKMYEESARKDNNWIELN